MYPRVFPALMALVVAALACSAAFGEEDTIGNLGGSRIGDYETSAPFWHKHKKLSIFVGVAGYPGKERGPVYVVLLHDPAGTKLRGSTPVNPTDDRKVALRISHAIGDGPWVQYEVLKEKSEEVFRIGDERYPLDKGRVFLVDQSTKPPTVQQGKATLPDEFRKYAAEGGDQRKAFTAALDKLRKESKDVDALAAKCERK